MGFYIEELPTELNGITMKEAVYWADIYLQDNPCDRMWDAIRALRDFYETVTSEAVEEADRKTENSSEKPNNCEKDCFLCKWLGDVDVCGRCRNRNLFAEADTEPTSSKMEQVEDEPLKTTDYCDICKRDMCEGCVADATNPYCVPSHYEINYEPKDEPLNQVKPTLAKNEPSLVKDLVKDEPQTERSE